MADWVNIDNSTIEPDAPLISSTVFALRDNPQAIAEGAAGAPRVENAGIAADSLDAGKTLAVEAGDVVRFSTFSEVFASTSTVFPDGLVVRQRILNPGSIRITLEHASFDSDDSEVRVTVNNSTVVTWSTGSSAYVARSIDVSISRNAAVVVEHRAVGPEGAGGTLVRVKNVRFRTSGGGLWPGADGFIY